MFINSYVGLDITNSDVRVIAIRKDKILKWSSEPLPEGVVKGGIIREPQALSVLLDNLFKSLKLKRNHVICTVTGIPFIYRTLSMPGKERIPAESIEREARREMSLAQEDMYMAWQARQTHPTTREAEYFVLGLPRISLDPLVKTLSKAKIKPLAIDVKPLALARAASLKNSLIVSLEKGYFDIVVVADGLVRVIHSVNPSSKSGDALVLVDEIADALSKAIKSFEREFPQNSLPAETPVILSGELSSDGSLPLLVQEATGHPATILKPSLNSPAGFSAGLYAAALGLLANKISHNKAPSEYHDNNINLLLSLKNRSVPAIRMTYAIAAICLVLLILVYKSYDLKTTADVEAATLQQKTEMVTSQLTASQRTLQAALAESQTIKDRIQNANKQLSAIRKSNAMIKRQRIDFSSRISSISDTFPEDDDFKTMELQSNTVKVTGSVHNTFDALDIASNLEKSSYFSGARVVHLAPEQDAGFTFQMDITNKAAK